MEQRKIKFRAKRLDNGKWVEGDLFKAIDSFTHVVGTYIGYHVCNKRGIIRDVKGVEIDSSTVCQFTGLKDKNGKEIFEGDYLLASSTIFDIEYVNCGFFASIKGLNNFVFNLKVLSKDGVICGSKFDRKEGE